MARLLVSSNQIGCLLGKGGAIIAEMRKLTGAYIRILGKDLIPKCASESEEVVQVCFLFDMVKVGNFPCLLDMEYHFLEIYVDVAFLLIVDMSVYVKLLLFRSLTCLLCLLLMRFLC